MFKKNNLIKIKQTMPYLFWLLIISVTVLLLIELKPSGGIWWPHLDKVVHASLFLLLSVTGYLSYARHKVSVFIGLVIFAATTEWLQSALTITRHGSIYDWLADLAGILLCIVIFGTIKKHFSTKA